MTDAAAAVAVLRPEDAALRREVLDWLTTVPGVAGTAVPIEEIEELLAVAKGQGTRRQGDATREQARRRRTSLYRRLGAKGAEQVQAAVLLHVVRKLDR